jgi:outer membrane protein assembly factor BamB
MMKHLFSPRLIVSLGFGLAIAASGEEWTEYRGPHGDGKSNESIPASWPATGLKRLWHAETPTGFSSFSVADGKAFTIVSRTIDGAPISVCLALDANTGKEIWAAPTGVANFKGGGDSGAEGNTGGDGPRSTPSVSNNRVYVYSADMVLQCLDAETGKAVWKRDIVKEFGGKNIGWKSAQSPVIDGGLVFVAGGGDGQSMLAFNKNTGIAVWKTGNEALTHATPVVATILGVKQVIFFMQSGLVALDASTGKQLWKFAFPYRTSTACSPVVDGNLVFCTAGYGIGAAVCEVAKSGATFEAKELWRVRGDTPLGDLWSTPVCKDGYLYGMISFKNFGKGPLKCVELKTGNVKWEQPGFGVGNVVLAGNQLIALADDGQLALVDANPNTYKETARMKAITGKCWSTPAVSDNKLYVRSTKEGACFELGK